MFTDEDIERVSSMIKNGYTGDAAESLYKVVKTMLSIQKNDIEHYKWISEKYNNLLDKGF